MDAKTQRRIKKNIFRFFAHFWLRLFQVLICPKNICYKYIQYGYQKTQNMMSILNLLKKHQESAHEESWRDENFCTQY